MSTHPPRRHPVLRSLTAVAATGVLLASAAGYAAAGRYDGKITRVQVFSGLPAGRPAAVPAAEASQDPINVLVVGVDNREGLTREQLNEWHLGHADYGNQTDTIMIVHVGRDASHASVVSLPRDSLVTIPEYTDSQGVTHSARHDKINAAFTQGGPALTVRTVEQATGIHIDHYVGVSFTGFMGMVDAVDGVEVCLTEPIKDNPKYTSLDLPAGKSTLRGGMALSFVRARHVGTDFGRIKRQQQFMASLLKKATSMGIITNPVALDSFVSSAAESLQVDETLDRAEILKLAQRFSAIKLDQIEFLRLPIADDNYTDPDTGRSEYVKWGEKGSRQIFDSIINDTPLVVQAAPTTAPAPLPSASASTPTLAVKPADIQVRVFNGSGVSGRGKQASTELEQLGFAIAAPADTSPDAPRDATVVRYDMSQTAALPTLQLAFPGAQFEPVSGLGSIFEITIGSSFDSVKDPSQSTASGTGGVLVRVLNGSGTDGLGTVASSALKGLGYTIASEPQMSEGEAQPATVVRYDPTQADGAERLHKALPEAQLQPVPGLGPVIEVTVGSDYSGVSSAGALPGAGSRPSASASPADGSEGAAEPQDSVVASSTVCS